MRTKGIQRSELMTDAPTKAYSEHIRLVLSGLPRDLSWDTLMQGDIEVVDLETIDKAELPFTLTLPTAQQDSYITANPYASISGTWTGGWGDDARQDKESYEDS